MGQGVELMLSLDMPGITALATGISNDVRAILLLAATLWLLCFRAGGVQPMFWAERDLRGRQESRLGRRCSSAVRRCLRAGG